MTLLERWAARVPAPLKSGPWRAFGLGLLAALALPPFFLLPLLWIVVPGLLRLLARAGGWRRAIWLGWCFGFGFNLLGLFWVTEPMLIMARQFWWAVPFAAPGLAAAVACYMMLPAAASYWIRPVTALSRLAMIFLFAGALAMANLAQQFLFTGFPWNYWGADWALPGIAGVVMMQPASVGGIYLLTLLTAIVAGLPLLGPRGWAAAGAVLAVWAGFGVWRTDAGPAPDHNLTVAMIQPDFAVPGSFTRPALIARWHRDLAMTQQALQAAGAGPKVVVWPETASPALLQTDASARGAIASVAGNTPVLAGSFRYARDGRPRNSLVAIEGAGPAVAWYDKWKLVPFGEYTPKWIPLKITPGGGFSPGPGPRTIHVKGIPPVGPLICYESIFSGEIVDKSDRPAWLLNISDNAWFGDTTGPRQDFATTRLRAVEEGLPLVIDTNSGISAVIGPHGRVVAKLGLDRRGVLAHRLPVALPVTPYGRFGLTMAGILSLYCVVLGLIFLIVSVTLRTERR
ncbi:apolipoprotein N-acyltransferase [Acidiphilium sp. AL]|uniref:apolipoprotein N-acyltransferase n=1 Tax=Acidiphilium sp. AL TaxID=2871704 RepID=UPI0021CB412E|nr:apolipoprotein N-acyltransferase [Acidiphilium sp. AL]MCU4159774.1 apolipoprotein N-acyltransferase [Acidiphilium sp. AL]